MTSNSCPRCAATRVAGPECPHCGVIYARAERRAVAAEPEPTMAPAGDLPGPVPESAPVSAAALFARDNELAEARMEMRLAWLAVPGALLGAVLLMQTGLGPFFMRTFSSMWFHELGHATAAWLTGFPAFPGPWFTPVAGERSILFALLITGGLGYAAWRGYSSEDRLLTSVAGGLLLVQLLGTLILRDTTAHTWMVFSGDAGGMVFGALMMAAFFVPPGHKLHRDWVRWGLLVLGAASFVDTFREWWAARHDMEAIVFGEIEGRADTDPTTLLQAGWSVDQMVHRYVGIGVLCLLALAALQVLHVRRTRAALEELEAGMPADVRRSA